MTATENLSPRRSPPSISALAAHGMYDGAAPAAGIVTGIGVVNGQECMIIANDATVKAGAFFPMTAKKVIRAQNI